jgi:tetrahydrodipicolinate N-succinyltransferase
MWEPLELNREQTQAQLMRRIKRLEQSNREKDDEIKQLLKKIVLSESKYEKLKIENANLKRSNTQLKNFRKEQSED